MDRQTVWQETFGFFAYQPMMDAMGVFYARFMDDWVVLAPTRWKLRVAISTVNQTLAALKVEQHPDKTFIGRISRGFDFLGYRFQSDGLIGVARQTITRFVERATRLQEQERSGRAALGAFGAYVRRWRRPARSARNAVPEASCKRTPGSGTLIVADGTHNISFFRTWS